MGVLITNDLHLGVRRVSGTTLESQQALKQLQFVTLRNLLYNHTSVIINGDLYDGFNVELRDILTTIEIFSKYLRHGSNRLTLCAGNHDHSPKGDKMSAFELTAAVLKNRFPDITGVAAGEGLTQLDNPLWVIPHMPNQALFDAELEKAVTTCTGGVLLLHCNYDNGYTEHSDHSLNISKSFLHRLNCHLVFGHEHHSRDLQSGDYRRTIVGCPVPTSISDCLDKKDKHALYLYDDTILSNKVVTWYSQEYKEIDWRDLAALDAAAFVRVIGTATAAEAGEVVKQIATLRSHHNAYVISNAVQIEGINGLDSLASLTNEQVKTFDVLTALYEMLDEKEVQTLKGLLP
jgi:hypothetical protein